jgi:hypothetical protein
MIEHGDYWIVEDEFGYGNAIVLKTAWTSRYLDIIASNKVRIIRLNQLIGWPESDVSFLLRIPNIHGVDIISDNVTDVSPVFQLSRLKTL